MVNSRTTVEEIKERLSIEEVVSGYVKLERSGINLRGLCPFHNEKSPSFFVSPERGSFMCFGCGKKGDIFTFVQEVEGLEFYDTLKQLAEQAGVKIEQTQAPKEAHTRAYALLEKACLFYQGKLSAHPEALEYLKGRGLIEKTITQFRIGFASSEWSTLYDELKKDFSEEEIIESGLIIQHENGKKYDRFRGRIMFPIFDARGKVIAFTGRILEADKKEIPKYINSPETALFSKSHILYAMNFARTSVRKHDFVILVEGQMDVIMSHQMGYTSTVASSGTAFTQHQLELISKLTKNLILAFDSDGAGVTTTQKVWETAVSYGLDVKIAYYKDEKDPADIIKESPDAWKEIIKKSIHIIEFVAHTVADIPEERARLKAYNQKIVPLLATVRLASERNFFVEKVAGMLGLHVPSIMQDIQQAQSQSQTQTNSQDAYTQNTYTQNAPRTYRQEQPAIIDNKEYINRLKAYLQFLAREKPDIQKELQTFLIENNLNPSELSEQSEVDEKILFEIEQKYEEDPAEEKKNFKNGLVQYIMQLLKAQNQTLRRDLHRQIDTNNEAHILSSIKKNKELMHSLQLNDCHFINNMF